jgi:cysteinyl-tRNA synthetase
MNLYNTLTKKQEKLKPVNPPHVTIYNCGPTVYRFPHIGNWRTFLVSDLLRRSLDYLGYQTKQVMNITDVGHLTSDADTGVDKIEREAEKESKAAYEITEFYLQSFLDDGRLLNIKAPHVMPRASEHIADMIELIKKLEDKGYTYQTSDGLYFDTSKFTRYGSLSGQKLEQKKAGARIELSDEKRNPTDFALWKFSPKEVKRQQEWPSPWGTGFPGWHIECSALSRKYLGQPFDIHTGGIDLIGVHHENEIAQSEAAYNKPLAKTWLHIEFLQMGQAKMSKSLGNFITIKDLIEKEYDPLAYRLLVLGAHYQSKQNFTWKSMDQAQRNLEKIRQTAKRLYECSSINKHKQKIDLARYRREFKKHLKDNLDFPKIMALIFDFLGENNRLIDQEQMNLENAQKSLELLIEWDQVLGLKIKESAREKQSVPRKIEMLVEQREHFRQTKQWVEADKIRHQIEELGYKVEDGDSGPKITASS